MLLTPIVAQSQGMDEPVDAVNEKQAGSVKEPADKNKEATNAEQNIPTLASKPRTQVNTNHQPKPPPTDTPPVDSGWNTANTFMVILTAILAACTYGLWHETKKIVKVTEQTAKRQLRAYVSARLADGEKVFLDENNCLSVPLIIENHGQTPAHNFRKSVFVNIFKHPIENVLDPPEYEGGSIACLFPGQKTRMYPTLPRPLNNAEITSIKNGEGSFCVWGYLEYVDIFGITQMSEFRMFSTGDDLERGELAYCEKGNNAT